MHCHPDLGQAENRIEADRGEGVDIVVESFTSDVLEKVAGGGLEGTFIFMATN